MSTEQAFEAEVSIATLSRRGRGEREGLLSRGRDAAVATGGIQGSDTLDEESPLLARGESIRYGPSGGDEDQEDQDVVESDADGFKSVPWYRRPSIYWMLPSVIVHSLAFGSILVPKINLILSLICETYFARKSMADPGFTFAPVIMSGDVDPRCAGDENVQALVAKFTLVMQLLGGLFAAFSTPRLGSLSDRYGRIKSFVITGVGSLTGELLTILAGRYPNTVSVHWILVGSAIDGICGSFTTSMAVANAFASDVTPPSRRAVTFGWMQGAFFTGIAIGPLIAAQIIEATGNVLNVFYSAIIAHAVVLLYLSLVVPETLSRKKQLAARERHKLATAAERREARHPWLPAILNNTLFHRFIELVNVTKDLSILWPTGPKATPALRRNLILLALVDTVQFSVAMGAMTVIILYTGKFFGWGSVDSSYFVATASIVRVLVLFFLLPAITRLVRGKVNPLRPVKNTGSDWLDLSLIWVALIFDILAYVGYATSKVGILFLISGCFASVGGMGSPTLQSSLTKHVPEGKTGQILGVIGLGHAVARVVAPTIFNSIWARTNSTYPQAVFVSLASTFGLSLLLSLFIRPHVYTSDLHTSEDEQEHISDQDGDEASNIVR